MVGEEGRGEESDLSIQRLVMLMENDSKVWIIWEGQVYKKAFIVKKRRLECLQF